MATIYDVAHRAGVSIGTVSNYLNNRYVGVDRSRAIRDAIEELHYTPNHVARSLKVSQSRQILLILPNISEGLFSELAATVMTEMRTQDYQVQLELTGNSPRQEQKALEACFSNSYAAVLLCTCMPGQTKRFEQIQAIKPLIFLLRRPEEMAEYCFIGFDDYDVVYRITAWLLEVGERELGLWAGPSDYSCERACVKAFRSAFEAAGQACPEKNVMSLPMTREILFRQATSLFAGPGYPRVILASSKLIADAITEAAYYQNIMLNQNICIISLGDGKWSNADQLYCNLSTTRSSQRLAQEACQYLMDCLKSPEVYERRIRQIRDDFSVTRLSAVVNALNQAPPPKRARPASRRLKIVSPDQDTGVLSIQYLTPWISENIDADIDLELLPVYDILPMVFEDAKRGTPGYDLVHLDNSWMQQIVDRGSIRDISEFFDQRPLLRRDLIPNLIEATATIQGRVYGAPSLLCSQMLFYRRDLFEDPVLQNEYAEKYGRALRPPKTWFEYLLIANFFTRSQNPSSPCEYGVIMGTADAEMMLTEVLARIWAYGGKVFDEYGNVTLYSDETVQAIANYIACLGCCEPSYARELLPSFPVLFAEGNAAMMIAYDIHACNLMNFSYSKVLDKIGFAEIPGRMSTMGGWNYCINVRSKKVDLCYRFLDALLSPELAIPYTLLGGGSPRSNVVCSPEVVSMYPWMQFSNETFQRSQPRYVPQSPDYLNPSESEVERILAQVVYQSISHPDRLRELTRQAEHQLKALRRPRC